MGRRLTLAALLVAASIIAARAQQERLWVTGDRATLREPNAGLDAYCKQVIPTEAANGLSAPTSPEAFRAWLQRLKTEKPAIAKCYDPGPPLRAGMAVTPLDSNGGCTGVSRRVRVDDGRIGCVNEEYLSNKYPGQR